MSDALPPPHANPWKPAASVPLTALSPGHSVRDGAETLHPRGVLGLGTLGRSEHDDAYTSVVAALPHDPPRRLRELRVCQHRREEDDGARFAQIEGGDVRV